MTGYHSSRVSFIGDLTQFPIPHLILSLREQKENGALVLRRERALKKVYFRQGQPVFAQSNLAREGILRFLFNESRLDLSRLEALTADEQPPASVGEWLIKAGLVSAHEFQRLNQTRLRSMLLDAFHWHEGTYLFLFDQTTPSEWAAYEEQIEVKPLAIEALKNEGDEEWLWRLYRDQLDRSPVLLADAHQVEETLSLNSREARVVQLIDGQNNVERIMLGSGLRPHAVLKILWMIEAFGLATYPRRSETESSAPEERMSELGVEGLNLIQRLQTRGEELLQLPVFEMLGIGRTFNEEELRRGYYTIAQNYHQKEYVDKLPANWRRLSYAVFERASNAFEALVVWTKKKEAGEFEPFIGNDDATFGAREYPYPAAEIAFLKGLEAYRDERSEEAIDFFADARTLEPMENDYRVWHTWLSTVLAGDDVENAGRTALAEMRRLAAEDSYNVMVQELCARAYERSGRTDEANGYYDKALRLNPDNAELRAGKIRTRRPVTAADLDTTATEDVHDGEKENEMRRLLREMQSADYFALLGVEREAGADDIRRRYFLLAKDYHPDRFKDTRLLGVAEQIFVLINEAYEVLSNEKRRRAYERSLRTIETQKTMQQREQQFSTERMMQKGKALLQSNEWEAACHLFGKAVQETKSDDWRFKIYYAWARFNRDFRRDPTAERQMEAVFQAALEADPGFVDVYLLQGKHFRRLEQWVKAKAKFDRVIQLDPGNREALRELRLINQRLGMESKAKDVTEKKPVKPGSEGKGIFRSLFGRKQE